MTRPQGDLSLLEEPVAQELLRSSIPARLAYLGRDGAPRVVPVAFHWDGTEIVFGTWPEAAKVAAIRERPEVALTIDGDEFPYKVLQVRGTARVEVVEGGPGVHRRRRALPRSGAGPGLGGADGPDVPADGADRDPAVVGWPPRLPGALPAGARRGDGNRIGRRARPSPLAGVVRVRPKRWSRKV